MFRLLLFTIVQIDRICINLYLSGSFTFIFKRTQSTLLYGLPVRQLNEQLVPCDSWRHQKQDTRAIKFHFSWLFLFICTTIQLLPIYTNEYKAQTYQKHSLLIISRLSRSLYYTLCLPLPLYMHMYILNMFIRVCSFSDRIVLIFKYNSITFCNKSEWVYSPVCCIIRSYIMCVH